MTVIGSILVVAGSLACLAGEWRFLVITYRHGLAWFLGCLLIPLVSVAFVGLHFRESWRAFGLTLAGLNIAGVGAGMAGLEWRAGG